MSGWLWRHRHDTLRRQRRRLHPCLHCIDVLELPQQKLTFCSYYGALYQGKMPWCHWIAPVEIKSFLIGCPFEKNASVPFNWPGWKFPHKVPFTKEEMHWCPCPFIAKHTDMKSAPPVRVRSNTGFSVYVSKTHLPSLQLLLIKVKCGIPIHIGGIQCIIIQIERIQKEDGIGDVMGRWKRGNCQDQGSSREAFCSPTLLVCEFFMEPLVSSKNKKQRKWHDEVSNWS